jgi:carboxyl-terminal processing protease
MFKTWKITLAFLLLIAITAPLAGGCSLIPTRAPAATPGPGVVKEAWDIISSQYVEPSRLDSANMTQAAIEGIIDTLHDPYTTYLTPAEYTLSQSAFSGTFEGIGAVVNGQSDKIVIISPMSGSPAEKAGIRAGDIIQAINGESTDNMSVDIAISKIRGPSGTSVKLLVLHMGETQPVELNVTRTKIELPSVHFEMSGDIAYIIISQFTERTENEFAPVIDQLKENNAKGIILDLRGNPGGLLDIVIRIASHFIPQGVIVQVRSNQGVVEKSEAVKGLTSTDLPMVVLVNEFSASGSEVLSGALQDTNRALIAGNTTYGKGSVNFLYRLSDGSGLYITGERWLTPNGRLIEGQGIQPDMKLDLTGDAELDWAIDYLKNARL